MPQAEGRKHLFTVCVMGNHKAQFCTKNCHCLHSPWFHANGDFTALHHHRVRWTLDRISQPFLQKMPASTVSQGEAGADSRKRSSSNTVRGGNKMDFIKHWVSSCIPARYLTRCQFHQFTSQKRQFLNQDIFRVRRVDIWSRVGRCKIILNS